MHFQTQEKINRCHHMGNAWVSSYISHSTGKCNKTHGMGKVWEIDNHNMGNACVFSSISHNVGKDSQTHQMGKVWEIVPGNILQNPLYVENLGNWYSYFSHSMGAFFPLDSHSMV